MRLFAVCVLGVCATAYAQVTVDEGSTRAKMVNGHTTVSLSLKNELTAPIAVSADIEWIDAGDARVARARFLYTAPPGNSATDAALPLPADGNALLYRLRYAISPAAANLTAFRPERGILAFPQIAEHAFRLHAMGIGSPRVGRPYEFRVFAAHPVTDKPAAGVRVTIKDAEDAAAITDEHGMAVIRLMPDADNWDDPDDFTVEGRLGDLVQSIEAHRPGLPQSQVRIYTDKPLYQPGQTLHLRTLAFGVDGHARADAEYAIRIRDEGSMVMHAADVTTSSFGIAHTDWEIPPNAQDGKYKIEVRNSETKETVDREIEVRRYELPSFRVAVQPDRPYYLKGQNATVEISADYLFGKPVTVGKVKVCKGDEEAALSEGALDPSGHFQAALDLSKTHENLADARFVDRHYIAYVTDAETNRTEQRGFDLRVSRGAIHIYVVKTDQFSTGRSIYISTYSPDGEPLAADVTVMAGDRKLGGARANRFGLARIDIPPEPMQVEVKAVSASDATSQEFFVGQGSVANIRLETDQSLYHAGEPIRCHITSDRKETAATVLAWSEDAQVLYSKPVQVKNGAAEAVIPYSARFGRALSIGVISTLGNAYQTGRTVLFPGAEELHITAQPAKDSYRPGEQASLIFQASNRSGTPVEAALGVAVVDESVFERVVTDRAANRRRSFDDFSSQDTRIAGFSVADLLAIDPAKIDGELQLVAETLLESPPLLLEHSTLADEQRQAFSRAARSGLAGVQQTLDDYYLSSLDYPRDEESLRRVVGYRFDQSSDPWMQHYRAEFLTNGPYDELRFVSGGPDKTFGTEDDLEAVKMQREWFLPVKALIRKKLDSLTDYPATPAEFLRVVAEAGIRFEALRDPWHNPLRVAISYRYGQRIVEIESDGPDHTTGTGDDFTIASYQGSFFRAMRDRIEQALRAAASFPTDELQFRAALTAAGLDLDSERDPWGHPYYLTFYTDARFGDSVQFYSYSDYQGLPERRKQLIPVKRHFLMAEIHSVGVDGVRNTYDDFSVAQFSRLAAEDAPQPAPAPMGQLPSVSLGGRGTVTGVVCDATGAVIPNAAVLLDSFYRTATDSAGRYYFRGVPPGTYTARIESAGFQVRVIGSVPVLANQVTRVDATLQVGAVSETVEVTAAAAMLETSSAEISQQSPITATSTPRVRDYFPETLLWNPELLTNSNGRAALNFKMADSITTWRVAVIASTADGRVAETNADVRGFQPFFVDLDPPQILTAGDEITLPVPVRNYLAKQQSVSIDATAPPALVITDSKQTAIIGPSSSANTTIRLRAAGAVPDARLRVTARASGGADAIEKPVSIHPDGEHVVRSVSDLAGSGRLMRINVPAGIIAGSMHSEVKIYPALLSHVIESIAAVLTRPSGCGEQIISASYPNLLVLRALKNSKLADAALEARAKRNLVAGYQRLLSLRADDGSFGYWPHGRSDVAITAYAIGFLEDAADLIPVDPAVLDQARAWIAGQDPESIAVSAVGLRALAKAGPKFEPRVVSRLGEFARAAARMDDPYAIATFALAAMESGKTELARPAVDRLRGLARNEQGAAYWDLRSNTPFYGWGRTGRIETTALAVSALSRWRKHAAPDAQVSALIDRGVLFLVRNQDASGIWLSTQATVRVFAAMLDALADGDSSQPFTVEISINGVSAGLVQIPGGHGLGGPLTIDVSRFIQPGLANEVSISAPSGHPAVQAQFTADWYQPWEGATTSPELTMQVRYSTAETSANQPVRCDVTVSRPTFRGYGMMIAEIGLPPGAEVDRGTLTELLDRSDTGVDSFEVGPGRVTLYLWPRANDAKFSFIFRPRFPMRVRMEPSALYDYYNPDARVVVPPTTLFVQ
jgi:hypothetical protein